MPAGNPTAATLIRKQDPKGSVRAATTAALPANTRVGNVLTADVNGALPAIDGVTLAVDDPKERLLVKDEVTGANKGIYDVTDVGGAGSKWVLTRSPDFDADEKVTSGAATFVSEGTVNAGREYTLITADPITVNTTALVFTQTGGTTPVAHDLGGAGHNADTLANLNTKVSDATLDDSGDPRTPTVHASDHTDGTDDIQNATAAQKGLATLTQIGKLDGIAAGAVAEGAAGDTHSVIVTGNPHALDAADVSAAPDTHVGAGGAAHADVVAAGDDGFMTGADKTKLDGIEAGAEVNDPPAVFSAESDGDSSTSGTAFIQKLRLTFTAEAADYLIFYSAEVRTANANVSVLARVQEDDTITHALVDLTQSSGVDNYTSFAGFKRVTLTAASHDFDIDFASETAGKAVNIRRARLVAIKVQ